MSWCFLSLLSTNQECDWLFQQFLACHNELFLWHTVMPNQTVVCLSSLVMSDLARMTMLCWDKHLCYISPKSLFWRPSHVPILWFPWNGGSKSLIQPLWKRSPGDIYRIATSISMFCLLWVSPVSSFGYILFRTSLFLPLTLCQWNVWATVVVIILVVYNLVYTLTMSWLWGYPSWCHQQRHVHVRHKTHHLSVSTLFADFEASSVHEQCNCSPRALFIHHALCSNDIPSIICHLFHADPEQ